MEVHPEPDQRVGRPPDAAALTSVLVEAFETYREWAPENWSPDGNPGERGARLLPERLAAPGYWCLISESGGQAVGYVILREAVTLDDAAEPMPGLGHLWHLFVRPTWWGTGVAVSLLNEAMDEARRRGHAAARLFTPRDNGRARAFYRREGWCETGDERYAPHIDLQIVEYRRSLEW
jgi:ribosomal protein S18 acetylase RimI-like enzyme